MIEPVIFALKMFIRVFEECCDNALRAIGHPIPKDMALGIAIRETYVCRVPRRAAGWSMLTEDDLPS